MPLFDARDIVAFPGGDNSSDTLIGGIHLNLTRLDHWNYTLYSNGTLSNGSWCVLTFEPYTPKLVHPNGSFVNVTYCYEPVRPIATRASIGIGFAVAFGLVLILTLVNLGKHGKRYLPVEKRFYPIGRRWQWYWAIFVSATAFISLITNIDVDRYYLPELPIVLNVFFWFLMQEGAMAVAWEAVRHWGSWMERQFIDPNPFELRQDDKRAKFEFYLPLFFYFWLWLVCDPSSTPARTSHSRHPNSLCSKLPANPSLSSLEFLPHCPSQLDKDRASEVPSTNPHGSPPIRHRRALQGSCLLPLHLLAHHCCVALAQHQTLLPA